MKKTMGLESVSARCDVKHGMSLLLMLLAVTQVAPVHGAVPPAAAYPVKPIRFVVPAAAGGGTDLIVRMIGAQMSEAWGQNVIVENRAGGGHTLAPNLVARANPDGYTLLITANSITVHRSLYRKMPYDLLRDLAPVSLVAAAPNLMVIHPSVKALNLKEFVALAKTSAKPMTYGSSGYGGTGHLAMELLKMQLGMNLVHVPYKSGGPALVAVIAGEVPVGFSTIVTATPHVKAGRLRALGVTSGRRAKVLPDLPTLAEAGAPNYESTSWFGVFTAAGTPPAIISKLSAELVRIMKLESIGERLEREGAEAVGTTPQELDKIMRADVDKWAKVIKAAGISSPD